MQGLMSGFTLGPLGLLAVLVLGAHGDKTESLYGAHAKGDIMIGILISAHSKVDNLHTRNHPGLFNCSDFDLIPFVRSLAAIHTIEEINNSSFLPGIRLGYIVCDPCADATKALYCVEHLLATNGSLPVLYDYSNFHPPIKVIMGARYSELSVAVARLLSVYMIPQLSCTSSAPILSDKLRYPSFMRVIPNDNYQTTALAKLMTRFEWDWVGVVSGDDDYGKAALQSLLQDTEKEDICIAFQEVVPHYLDHGHVEQRMKEVAARVHSMSDVQVVVLILKPELVKMLFEQMIQTNTTRIWIASDAWSMNRHLTRMKDINKVGNIFGFTFVTGKIPQFEEYLRNLRPSPGASNQLISEYKQLRFNCTSEVQTEYKSPMACNVSDPLQANDDFLINAVDLTETYSERVAVWAIAHAIKNLLKCNETGCSEETDFPPWKLLQKIQEVNFTLSDQLYSFDPNGDFEDGYDMIMWGKNGEVREFIVAGKYRIKQGVVEIENDKIHWDINTNNSVPRSKCSESCAAGTKKVFSDIACCYNCTKCLAGTFSNTSDQGECQICPSGTWSLEGQTKCEPREEIFLRWSDPHSIVLVVGAILGILLTLTTVIIFTTHRGNSFIDSTHIKMSCLMSLGLMVSFGSVVTFIDRPIVHICRAQQLMYGLGFTFCVSSILVKALHTFQALTATDPNRRSRLNDHKMPYLTVILSTTPQALVCLFWLIFASPYVSVVKPASEMNAYLFCDVGSKIAFGVMHSYIALLALVSFIVSFRLFLGFRSRNVRPEYNETSNIIFSMLIHLFVWLCFIPIFITQPGQQSIVQVSAILVSNYGIVFCHFIPKCYEVLSENRRRGQNNETTTEQSVAPPGTQDSEPSPGNEPSEFIAVNIKYKLWNHLLSWRFRNSTVRQNQYLCQEQTEA
ncbi:G-protein coupled receptor family C group 6 member A-like [Chanos chanos]|uniref:G-protein coupled receptor family C group 6 member A n=1 Tax=Chanos chanos TaxID=29144 RepID=A0A6J2V4G8_CHACN|nr:G-protein coupled receptor family C group 6 member A-like [Chanos chanos]